MLNKLHLKLRSIINPYAEEEALAKQELLRSTSKKKRRRISFSISKRQRFIISVIILSLGFFFRSIFLVGTRLLLQSF